MHTNIPNTRLDTLIKAVLTGVAPLKKDPVMTVSLKSHSAQH